MTLNTHQWMSIGFLSGLALLWKRDKPEPEECKNVKALVAYTCAECGEDRGLFEVKDGNFYRFNPDLRDCGCDGFEVNSNEFITCEDCDDTFWHRYAGWSEHLRIIMNRDEDESFEADEIKIYNPKFKGHDICIECKSPEIPLSSTDGGETGLMDYYFNCSECDFGWFVAVRDETNADEPDTVNVSYEGFIVFDVNPLRLNHRTI